RGAASLLRRPRRLPRLGRGAVLRKDPRAAGSRPALSRGRPPLRARAGGVRSPPGPLLGSRDRQRRRRGCSRGTRPRAGRPRAAHLRGQARGELVPALAAGALHPRCATGAAAARRRAGPWARVDRARPARRWKERVPEGRAARARVHPRRRHLPSRALAALRAARLRRLLAVSDAARRLARAVSLLSSAGWTRAVRRLA